MWIYTLEKASKISFSWFYFVKLLNLLEKDKADLLVENEDLDKLTNISLNYC